MTGTISCRSVWHANHPDPTGNDRPANHVEFNLAGCGVLSQDTYWCHTVSAFTAFSPNRIGEYDTYYRIYWSTQVVQ